MRCPDCLGEMECGYLLNQEGIFWDSEKRTFRILFYGKETIVEPSYFFVTHTECYRCKLCNLFIFYKQKNNPRR